MGRIRASFYGGVSDQTLVYRWQVAAQAFALVAVKQSCWWLGSAEHVFPLIVRKTFSRAGFWKGQKLVSVYTGVWNVLWNVLWKAQKVFALAGGWKVRNMMVFIAGP